MAHDTPTDMFSEILDLILSKVEDLDHAAFLTEVR
jgi:hypothetical protein